MLNSLTDSHLAAIQDTVIAFDPLTMARFDEIHTVKNRTKLSADENVLCDCDRESWTLASPFCNPDF